MFSSCFPFPIILMRHLIGVLFSFKSYLYSFHIQQVQNYSCNLIHVCSIVRPSSHFFFHFTFYVGDLYSTWNVLSVSWYIHRIYLFLYVPSSHPPSVFPLLHFTFSVFRLLHRLTFIHSITSAFTTTTLTYEPLLGTTKALPSPHTASIFVFIRLEKWPT